MYAKSTRSALALGLGAIVLAMASPALAYIGRTYARQAAIGIEQARGIALRAYPGRITGEELEREGGGSGLRYSFDIERGRITHEVGVDARTGRVLENAAEGRNRD